MQNLGVKEASARLYTKPFQSGRPIADLLRGEIIRASEHCWIVIDEMLASVMMMRKKSLLMYTVNRGIGVQGYTPLLGCTPVPLPSNKFFTRKINLNYYCLDIQHCRDRTQAKCTPSRLHSRQGHKGRRTAAQRRNPLRPSGVPAIAQPRLCIGALRGNFEW